MKKRKVAGQNGSNLDHDNVFADTNLVTLIVLRLLVPVSYRLA